MSHNLTINDDVHLQYKNMKKMIAIENEAFLDEIISIKLYHGNLFAFQQWAILDLIVVKRAWESGQGEKNVMFRLTDLYKDLWRFDNL